MKTTERLAQALHAVGLLALERRALAGEFSDFASPLSFPKLHLMTELADAKAAKRDDPEYVHEIDEIRYAVKHGEYDDTKEEAEEWFRTRQEQFFGDGNTH